MTKQNEAVVNTIRTWIFPGLAALVGAMMWSTLNEIRSDLKTLMSQSAIDKTRIDNLERAVFGNKNGNTNIPGDRRLPEPPYNMIAIMPSREEFIPIKVKKKTI